MKLVLGAEDEVGASLREQTDHLVIEGDQAFVNFFHFFESRYERFSLHHITFHGISDRTTLEIFSKALNETGIFESIRKIDFAECPSAFRRDELNLFVDAVSHKTHVQSLDLHKNRLAREKRTTLIMRLLSVSQSLQHLDLSHNGLCNRKMLHIAQGLKHNESLRTLNLSYNNLGNPGIMKLTTGLATTALVDLDLTYTRFQASGARHIATLLRHNRTIQRLNLSMNDIGPDGAHLFRHAMQQNHVLRYLNLSRCNLRRGVQEICRGILDVETDAHQGSHSNLEVLDLSWNSLICEDVNWIAPVVHRSILKELNLSSNAISDHGLRLLANAVIHDHMLEKLDLVGNQMEDPEPLVSLILRDDNRLAYLGYERNKFDSDALERIENAVLYVSNRERWLESLGERLRTTTRSKVMIKWNQYDFCDYELVELTHYLKQSDVAISTAEFPSERVTDQGVQYLAQVASRFYRLSISGAKLRGRSVRRLFDNGCLLKSLSLTNCSLRFDSANVISRSMSRTMTNLTLDGNRISDAGAKEILEMPGFEVLTSLNLANNRLGDKAVSGSMTLIRQLEVLHLDGNNLSDIGALDLAKHVGHATSLRWLNLKGNHLTNKGVQVLHIFLSSEHVLDADGQRTNGRHTVS